MKEIKRKMLSLITVLMLLLAVGFFGGCANNHPIEESKLPDFEKQQQEEQQQQDQSEGSVSENADDASAEVSGGNNAENSSDPSSETLISEAEAIGIALSRVPGADESHVVSFGKDYDDGRWTYEGEIRYDGLEYDFEIDAQTGNLLEWEIDD